MKKKHFAIIGMGRFGSSVARTLYDMGFEVLAVDRSERRIQEVLGFVTHGVSADTTDEDALRDLNLKKYDVVVVAIGEDIQASILTTLILKQIGVKMTVVKATSELHGKVLKKTGADKVVYPERDMGQRVAHHLVSSNILDYIELSSEHSIVEIKATSVMIGKDLITLDIRAKYGCNVIAIKSNTGMNISPDPLDPIKDGDVLVVVGSNTDLKTFEVMNDEA